MLPRALLRQGSAPSGDAAAGGAGGGGAAAAPAARGGGQEAKVAAGAPRGHRRGWGVGGAAAAPAAGGGCQEAKVVAGATSTPTHPCSCAAPCGAHRTDARHTPLLHLTLPGCPRGNACSFPPTLRYRCTDTHNFPTSPSAESGRCCAWSGPAPLPAPGGPGPAWATPCPPLTRGTPLWSPCSWA